MISILILTLNEEGNLADCLNSVRWCDDIVVFDSFSSDQTVDIAQSFGVRVIQRKFDNWSCHQNWALRNICFQHPWVFYLDADERMTDELKSELLKIANDCAENRVAFYVGRKNYFMGKWIKHSYPPSMIMRFFLPSQVRFERQVNPTPVISGSHGYLKHYFEHYNFSKGMTEWFDKHNKYSCWEAEESLKVLRESSLGKELLFLFSMDKACRRQSLKKLSVRMPFRFFLKFIYLYVAKGGFIDGKPGLIYCILQSMYEYMIVLKTEELLRADKR
ncbi:glycosyltransferase family 2 protein [Verrucomicrobiota bacterium]